MPAVAAQSPERSPEPIRLLEIGAIPLVTDDGSTGGLERRETYWVEESAQQALETGVYDVAYQLASRSWRAQSPEGAFRPIALVAVDASLASERWIEAIDILQSLEKDPAAPGNALRLRRAMVAFAENDAEEVEDLVDDLPTDGLSISEQAWLSFLDGWSRLRQGRQDDARSAFEAARALALQRSPALAAQIGYLVFRSQLATRTMDAETVPQLQSAALENRGRSIGFAYAQQLAVALFEAGDVEGAISLLEKELAALGPDRGQERAQFQLLQTMAAGLGRLEGRQAFQDLLTRSRFPGLMSIALQQAFTRARAQGGLGKELVTSVLDRLISQETEHPLLDQALYYRAVFKFQDADYDGAEEDAVTLQRRFPSSPFRRGVLALQASAAWHRSRYRTAASYLRQMRTEFPDLTDSGALSALIADCNLRAGIQSGTTEDFRNAAEEYATALSSSADAGQGGPLFFQLTLAHLRAGQIDQAIAVLDNPALRALADGEMIWRAEWMLIKEMRSVGRVSDGYERAQAAIALADTEPALRLRLLWQAVKLSFESGAPEDTEYWTDRVNEFIESNAAAIGDPELIEDVKASSLLSLAESRFVLEEPEDAVELLKRLRSDYGDSEAALLSYIAEARYYSSVDQSVDAQRLLVSLADNHPKDRLAPIALYEAAINAERRGEDAYLDQANKLLQRIASDYPESEMVYYARLKQADLLRKLNKFGSAERIYEFLEIEYANRPDRYLAQMSLADTLLAQAVEDPAKFEAAIARLELLMDLPDPRSQLLGLRVEAGYKLGQAWRSRGETLKAKSIFWLLYDLSVREEPRFRALTRKGRFWLARCLFDLAEIAKDEGKVDEADQYYGQVVNLGLWGADLAEARLESLEPGAAN